MAAADAQQRGSYAILSYDEYHVNPTQRAVGPARAQSHRQTRRPAAAPSRSKSSPEQSVANNSTVHVVSDLPGVEPGEESERRTV